MSALFGILAFLAFVAFIIGLIKPSLVVFWGKRKTAAWQRCILSQRLCLS
jgi:hypothetical protein